MNHLYLATALLAASAVNAQTTALDFTANDCDGVPHTLFSELDAGDAVILELVMMGCQPCVDAGHSIVDNVLPNVTDPARVRYYSIGYTNSISCAQMNNWRNTNGFTHTVFAGMSAQTTHYGGMGMPTVVVVGGGSTHGVFYNELGHDDADNPAIIAAVNDALLAANAIGEQGIPSVTLGPNPVTTTLQLNGTYRTVVVMDMKGRVVLSTNAAAGTMDVAGLPAGTYQVKLTTVDGARAAGRFVKL